MNKSYNITLLLITMFVFSIYFSFISGEKLSYQLANIEDINEIMELYAKINASDYDSYRLLVLPSKQQKQCLTTAIKQKRFFIVKNERNKIISFKKFFIISKEEIKDILENELNCIGKNRQLINYEKNKINFNPIKIENHTNIKTKKFFPSPNDILIYLGSEYTIDAYRGKQISTKLTIECFEKLKNEIFKKLNRNASIYLLLGLVDKNASRTSLKIGFALSLNKILFDNSKKAINLSCFKYKAFKPVLIEGNLVPQTPGMGCILQYKYKEEQL